MPNTTWRTHYYNIMLKEQEDTIMKERIIAIANQKGGVGKTTTVVNIAAGLAEQGKKVLCIDLDPQGNLSDYLGYDFSLPRPTVVDVFKGNAALSDSIVTCEAEHIDYIAADITLATADMFLAQTMCREQVLKRALDADKTADRYDYILIDCLPSLGVLVTNALSAADGVIIPVQVQKFALNGIVQFEDIFNLVKENINPALNIVGILETMTDGTNMAREVDKALKERYDGLVFNTSISKRIEAANSTAEQKSLITKRSSVVGDQYRQLVAELLSKEEN